jgi:hypothetical protein
MNITLALEQIQKTRRFQILAFAGLVVTYPFALIPVLFKIFLDIDPITLEMMAS